MTSVLVEKKPKNPKPADCWHSEMNYRITLYVGSGIYTAYSESPYTLMWLGQDYAAKNGYEYKNMLMEPEFPDFVG
jgi:hypothetical protein